MPVFLIDHGIDADRPRCIRFGLECERVFFPLDQIEIGLNSLHMPIGSADFGHGEDCRLTVHFD